MKFTKHISLVGMALLLQACNGTTVSTDVDPDGDVGVDSDVILDATYSADFSAVALPVYSLAAINGNCRSTKEFSIESVSATSYRGSKAPSRAIDGKLNGWSRWSASGRGEAITFDLGSTQEVDSIKTAWYRADERVAYFDVETSTNNSNWTKVLTDASTTGSEGFVGFALQSSKARYVKVIGQGNSSNAWSSLIEMEIYGCNEETTEPPTSCSSMDNLKINSASSNDSYASSENPSNAIDNNLSSSSRWSSDGQGNSIILDLGQTSTVRRLSTAWYKGDVRQAYFDVQTSSDQSNWTTVLYQATASGTDGMIDFDVTATDARYVRIVGQGNSASTWNSIIEVDVYGCGIEDDTPGPTTTPPTTSTSIDLIKSLFVLEGGNNDLTPYRTDTSLVFDALSAKHVTSNGNGWRHELKMDIPNRKDMSDTTEQFKATIKADLSRGSKTIVAQYHGGDLGTLVKVYISDTNESGHIDSRANNGIFDVYVRLRPEGESQETVVDLGTITSGQSFDLDMINDRGRVTVSGMGVTRQIDVADSDQAYLKFGNYLQAQEAESGDDIDDSDDWAEFYDDAGISTSVVTFTNVFYTNTY